jgi:hypothetical protein
MPIRAVHDVREGREESCGISMLVTDARQLDDAHSRQTVLEVRGVTGPWRKPRKWNLPLTYAPKIPGVIDGTIRQTIRVGRKFRVGDLVSFHGWEGRPYRSKWSFRTPYFTLTMARAIRIVPGGIVVPPRPLHGEYYAWRALDDLAARDGIEPPTGEALRDVLLGMHKIPADGIEAQILRWRWWTV